jgi:flavin-dependent dehydrogenase
VRQGYFGGGLTDLPHEVDVLVAGSGPAGSATAVLLARAGFSVLATDRAAFPREKPCAEYMSPEAVRVLARLGVVEAIENAGAAALEGMKLTASQGATAHGLFAQAGHKPYRATGLSVSRRILDHELVRAASAAGARVIERTSVEELLRDQSGVRGAIIRDPSGRRHSIRARLTVGADGLHSVVARRLGKRTHGSPRRMAFVAHIAGVQSIGSSAELHFGRTSYVGLNGIGNEQTNVAVVVPSEHAVAARGRSEAFFWEALQEFPRVYQRVRAGQIVRPVLVTGPFAARSHRVVARGSLLVGDAADFFDPVTGDGIYSALRGAELVAETMIPALSDSDRAPHGLRQYQRRRREVFAGKWIMERITRYLMYSPRLFDRSVSRLGRHRDMAHTTIGVTGGYVPLRAMLHPSFIARMVL